MSDPVASDHGDLAATGTASPTPGDAASNARTAVAAALDECDAALAAWEGGSAAFGRADDSSDLDVVVLCIRGGAQHVLDAVEHQLESLGQPLDRWDVGRSTFGVQRFWRPAASVDEPAWCLVDVSVIEFERERDLWRELLLPERHGRALELHDPEDRLARCRIEARFDTDAHRARIRAELATLREKHAMFRDFVDKELARERALDAHAMHQAMVVNPLVVLVNMAHRPLRFDFGQRYLHAELPADVVARIAPILRPSLDDVADAARAGRAWIDALLDSVDVDALPIEAHAQQMRLAFG